MVKLIDDVYDISAISTLCYKRYDVDFEATNHFPQRWALSTGGVTVEIKEAWPVSRILQIASRMQAAEAMLLAHDASCFCAACLAKPKDAA